MIEFRPYQEDIIKRGTAILKNLGIVYLSMEVRTGKTLTALGIANNMNVKNVLFITKKKAIVSIHSDYKQLSTNYPITVVNYESLHKSEADYYDLFIVDEAHSLGAFPKPSKRTKNIKALIGKKPLILLSGTPTPESFSQIFHQFWISDFSPFKEVNFYKWAKTYTNPKTVYLAYGKTANDYSDAKEEDIQRVIAPYMISYTQKQAGFTTEVKEEVLTVEMLPTTYALVEKLEKDLVFEGKNGGVILCDTPVKLMQKVHQIYSGTVKLEDGSATILDKSKAEFIKERFKDNKIAIFYKFKEELTLLKRVFGLQITENLQEFSMEDCRKHIALQIVSGREGISLKAADYLVFYNIDFSATSYWQARDRLTTKMRANNKVFWIFSKNGIEEKIYRTVLSKKNYTLKHFNHDRSQISKQTYLEV